MYEKQKIYEFDPSGGLAANRVPAEPHNITPANGSNFDFFIPSFAPFFRKNLVVKHVLSGQILTEGLHFDLGLKFEAASLNTQTPVYGAIVILDRTLAGRLEVTYQTIGGEWVLDDAEILTILANATYDPRTTTWEAVIDKPITFPPVDHLHHSDDFVGMDDVRKAILACADEIGGSAAKALLALLEHVRDHANPHNVTLAQLGLDSLGTLQEATTAEIDQGTNRSHFVSPFMQAYHYGSVTKPYIDAHIGNTNNPHQVNKTQIGLSNVQNYTMATDVEAVAGSLTNRYMSPKGTRLLAADMIAEAIRNNQTSVTKESIGLGLVENYPPATQEQAVAGTSNEVYLTALRGMQAITNAVQAAIAAHLASPNPHNITKTVVGLGNVENNAMASEQEALAGVLSNRNMSPLRTSQFVTAALANAMASHLAANNPHNITKADVGLGNVANFPIATQQQLDAANSDSVIATVAGITYMINKVVTQGAGGDLSAHLRDFTNPHDVTKAQVGLSNVPNYPAAGTTEAADRNNNNTLLTPLGMWSVLLAQVLPLIQNHINSDTNPHSVTKAQVGLSNLQNYPAASLSDLINPTSVSYVTNDILNQGIWSMMATKVAANSSAGDVAFADTTAVDTGGHAYGKMLIRTLRIAPLSTDALAMKQESTTSPVYCLEDGNVWNYVINDPSTDEPVNDWVLSTDPADSVSGFLGRFIHTTKLGTTHFLAAYGDVILIAKNSAEPLIFGNSAEIRMEGVGTAASPLTPVMTGTIAKNLTVKSGYDITFE